MPALNATELLAKLVSFDTTSRNSNLPLIEWIEGYLDGFAVPHLRVDYEQNRKTNLYATIGPDVPGGIVLSGHTDVVPVDGQSWTSDPFTLAARDGNFYGRGTADMKGFLAVALAMLPRRVRVNGAEAAQMTGVQRLQQVECLRTAYLTDEDDPFLVLLENIAIIYLGSDQQSFPQVLVDFNMRIGPVVIGGAQLISGDVGQPEVALDVGQPRH